MFGASETPYDLRFQLLGIPVRIHPFFWLVAAMLGWRSENIPLVLIWVGCVFLSILIHEYGHGLTARAYGASPTILLHAFGGLCIYQADRQSPRQRLAVLLWGPGAGFVFCLVVMMVFSATFGLTPDEHIAFVKSLLCRFFSFLRHWSAMLPDDRAFVSGLEKLGLDLTGRVRHDPHVLHTRLEIYASLLEINILWGLINLLPVWPLDGGQITQTILSQVNPYNGRRWTHIVSLVVAALCAIVIYSQSQSLFNTLFFAYFAVINYQMLDSIHRAQSMGIYDDDGWRR
jgi:Zn-dependent protease